MTDGVLETISQCVNLEVELRVLFCRQAHHPIHIVTAQNGNLGRSFLHGWVCCWQCSTVAMPVILRSMGKTGCSAVG